MRYPLFAYGTLCDPDLLAAVLGRLLPESGKLAAAAPGFRSATYPGRPYPGLLRAPGAGAPGLVLMGLTGFETDLVDAYEGDEYRRELIPVMIGEELHEAFAYLPTATIPAHAPDWTLADWQLHHKPSVLVAERAAADQLRLRLIAIRPH